MHCKYRDLFRYINKHWLLSNVGMRLCVALSG